MIIDIPYIYVEKSIPKRSRTPKYSYIKGKSVLKNIPEINDKNYEVILTGVFYKDNSFSFSDVDIKKTYTESNDKHYLKYIYYENEVYSNIYSEETFKNKTSLEAIEELFKINCKIIEDGVKNNYNTIIPYFKILENGDRSKKENNIKLSSLLHFENERTLISFSNEDYVLNDINEKYDNTIMINGVIYKKSKLPELELFIYPNKGNGVAKFLPQFQTNKGENIYSFPLLESYKILNEFYENIKKNQNNKLDLYELQIDTNILKNIKIINTDLVLKNSNYKEKLFFSLKNIYKNGFQNIALKDIDKDFALNYFEINAYFTKENSKNYDFQDIKHIKNILYDSLYNNNNKELYALFEICNIFETLVSENEYSLNNYKF
jgi:hypothetical protein